MPKKRRPSKSYDIITFVASILFPPSNPLAMDILRLMSAYNDLSEVVDWMIGMGAAGGKRIAWKRARIRMSIQNRILLGLLHEAFVVLDQMQGTQEFKVLEEKFLSGGGKEALMILRLANSGGTESIRSRLSDGRNQVAFHYDREAFEKGATVFSRMFVEKDGAESTMIYERNSRAYFYYAEQVRENVGYGFNEVDGDAQIAVKLGQYLTESKKLAHKMGGFLDELLLAYTQMNNLDSVLKHESVKE
jgi:hypothetical protein